ncbi:efflux RND transporter periplasmic adaptor subunit [Chryseobacterium pennae]|nr:efflux RND transporter periplasmic adaptor subunit [Chryseobacterium pennae]
MNIVKKWLALSSLIFLAACQKKEPEAVKEAIAFYPTLSIAEEEAVVYNDYPVVLQGKKDVELRPKIDGFIEAILVDEGQKVKKGQVLFRIYAPQFKEENVAAIAGLSRAEAELKDAGMKVKKVKPLVEESIISNYELESAQYNLKSKEALFKVAKSNLSNTEANVRYTQIVAPFDGVIGLIPFKEGALVSSSSIKPLTVISDISSIHTYLSMNEKQFFDFTQQTFHGSLQERIDQLPQVSLILANETEYSQKGKITSVSGQFDPLTGSINFRAVFNNKEGLLRSGNSARVRVFEKINNAVLVPQKATFDLQGKRFVYVVGSNAVVKSREVRIMEKEPSGQQYIVTSGLNTGDRIVSADIGGLKDGVKIKLK